MTETKFDNETKILREFFCKYCKDKHSNQLLRLYNLEYKNSIFKLELNLCTHCHEMIFYSFNRLKECSHEEKPRCRKCPTPCYEKQQWKNLAKIMRYSSIELGITKMKNKIINFLK